VARFASIQRSFVANRTTRPHCVAAFTAAARDGRPPWRGETVVASSRPLSVRHILEAAGGKPLVGRNKPARRTVLPSLYPHDTGSDFDRRRGQNWIGGFRALRPVRSRIWRKAVALLRNRKFGDSPLERTGFELWSSSVLPADIDPNCARQLGEPFRGDFKRCIARTGRGHNLFEAPQRNIAVDRKGRE